MRNGSSVYSDWPFVLLLAATATALVCGIQARFDGLGAWPFAVDEYYIARSVDNILRFGVPAYECGGFYTRGLPYQYAVAGLRLADLPPELAARLVTVLASLAALPAAYLIGRRVHGPAVGLLAVGLMAISVWEVEIARFGRMYAPFQAIFLWYVVFFLRFTVDGERRALWPMLALSVLGALTWEGGIFLALANLLPPFLRSPDGRFRRHDWVYLAGAAILVLPLYFLVTADLRHFSDVPALPDDFFADAEIEPAAATPSVLDVLRERPLWLMLALLPAVAAIAALRWPWSMRHRWVAAAGLALALALALVHQLAAFGTVLLALLLIGALDWRELAARPALPYWTAVLLAALFWLGFGAAAPEWVRAEDARWLGGHPLVALAYEMVRFPDYLQEIALPWGRAMPALSLGLFLLLAACAVRLILQPRSTLTAERVLLVLILSMAAAASASDPPRHETRYLFFVYPVLLVVAGALVVRVVERPLGARRWATAAGVAAAALLFVFSEDFRPRHLVDIETARVNFRLDVSRRERAHLLPRGDVRGAAEWIARHSRPEDLVINGVPSVDYYFDGFDFTYVDRGHQRYGAYACRRGTVERWGNLPLLASVEDIDARIATADRSFLVLGTADATRMLRELAHREPQVVWTSIEGDIQVVAFAARAGQAHARVDGTGPDR